jgi:hypothetical protein
MINRAELRGNLTKFALDKHIIDPALQLLEPLLRTIEQGYALDDTYPVKNEELRDAILCVTDTTTVVPKRIRIGMRSSTEERLLLPNAIGDGFSKAMIGACGGAAVVGGSVIPFRTLGDFSLSLSTMLMYVFANRVESRLDQAYANNLVIKTISTHARESVEATIACYLNLTANGQTALVKQHVKRPLLLLSRAIPLANTKQKDDQWTVLIP